MSLLPGSLSLAQLCRRSGAATNRRPRWPSWTALHGGARTEQGPRGEGRRSWPSCHVRSGRELGVSEGQVTLALHKERKGLREQLSWPGVRQGLCGCRTGCRVDSASQRSTPRSRRAGLQKGRPREREGAKRACPRVPRAPPRRRTRRPRASQVRPARRDRVWLLDQQGVWHL